MMFDVLLRTSIFLFHAKLPLQCLSELPLPDQLHLQLCPLQLVLLLLRPGVLYGNPQQTLLGDTQAHINRLHTEQKPGEMSVCLLQTFKNAPGKTFDPINISLLAKACF